MGTSPFFILKMEFSKAEDIIKALEEGQEVSFYTWTPIEKADSNDGRRMFRGIASTEDIDLQGEKVYTKGLDIDYFKDHGYFNDDHKQGPAHKIGQPTKVEVRPEGLYVEGFLFKNHPVAEAYWTLMNSLDESGASRKVGLSIEGKVKRRIGSNVPSAWIKDIAITCAPINTKCWIEVMKALSHFYKSCNCGGNPCICKTLSSSSEGVLVPLQEPVEKSLTFDAAMVWLHGSLGIVEPIAKSIVNYAFKRR